MHEGLSFIHSFLSIELQRSVITIRPGTHQELDKLAAKHLLFFSENQTKTVTTILNSIRQPPCAYRQQRITILIRQNRANALLKDASTSVGQ